MRPDGDMTLKHSKGREWFRRKVGELVEAIDQLPDDRADLVEQVLEAEDVPLFTEDEMKHVREQMNAAVE